MSIAGASAKSLQARFEELLFSKGKNVNDADQQGRTLLHDAAQQGSYTMAFSLLNAKAQADQPDQAGKTPLSLATSAEVRELLQNHMNLRK